MLHSLLKTAINSKSPPGDYVQVDHKNVTDLQTIPSTVPQTCSPAVNQTSVNISTISLPSTNNYVDDFEMLIDNTHKRNEDDIQRQFSVTVAVEAAGDEEEFASNTNNIEDEINEAHNHRPNLEDTVKNISPLQSNVIQRNNILVATDKIQKESTNIADQLLCIDVKNSLGYFQKQLPTMFEIKIQSVFDQWQEWQKLIVLKFRSSPLFYKCYICDKSWWYYYDFREHLKQHEYFELELEQYTLHEANVIAYSSLEDIIDIKHFHTDGDCPKCGKEFAVHKLTNRLKDCYYRCKVKGCYKKFATCFALSNHEFAHSSRQNLNEKVPSWKKCALCNYTFHTMNEHETHMHLMHSVRSDVVIPFIHKKCMDCESNYVCNWLHICLRNTQPDDCCEYCFRILPASGKHFNKNMACVCKICNASLPKQCMLTEHTMKHSDKFMLVKTCMLCDEFKVYLSDDEAFNHMLEEHFKWNNQFRRRSSIYSILIPKSCITANEEKSLSTINNISAGDQPQASLATPAPDLKTITVPEIKIKEEIKDDIETAEYVEDIVIKQEFEYEENPVMPTKYTININSDINQDGLFNIKIDHIVKQETDETQESEYEDDIIRLDYSYTDSIQDSQQDSSRNSLQDSSQDCIRENEVYKMRSKKRKKYKYTKTPKVYTCSKCGFTDYHKSYREHQKSGCSYTKSFEDGTFKCTKCTTSFDTFLKYTQHLTEHGVKAMSCPECFNSFSSYLTLLPHISAHIQRGYISVRLYTVSKQYSSVRHKCKSCLEDVETTEFFAHWESHLTFVERKETKSRLAEESNLLIGHSLDNTLLQELLRRLQTPHKGSRSDKPGCMICHKHFERRSDCKRHLIEHLLFHALSRKQYNNSFLVCQICGRGFHNQGRYKKHMRDHGNLTIYECDLCNKTFSDSSNFAKHKKLHNENAYVCDICNKKFQAKVSIEKHIKLHETEISLECQKCKRIFHLESALKRHIRSAHLSNKYRCSVCFNYFETMKEKWDHMWQVHNERKYEADCPVCKKSYRKYSDLKRHVQLHNLRMKSLKADKKKPGSRKIALVEENGKVLKYF